MASEDRVLTEYLTEQEQIELLKSWIKQYSVVILTGVLMAIIGITGWRYWQQRQAITLSHASAVYDEMLTKRAQNDTAGTTVQADKLSTHYPRTVYGQMGALMLAREAVIQKNYPDAIKQLSWVLDHTGSKQIRQLTRIRLARVYIADNQIDLALKTLNKVDDKSFNGLIDEVKGDAYLAQKNIDQARESYKQALSELPNAESIRPLLEMKYDNLATLPKT